MQDTVGELLVKLLVKFVCESLCKEELTEDNKPRLYVKQICDNASYNASDLPNIMNNRIG